MRSPDPEALRAGALALGVTLDESVQQRLTAYLALLLKWNRVYNLTAVRDPSQMLVHHLLDSLAVIPPLRRWTTGRSARLLDVGSGAGLPGFVIALLQPEIEVTCVDAVGKKAAFIRQAAGELGLRNLRVLHARVETVSTGPFDIIVSRAFASLADFVALTREQAAPGSVWMAMKGQDPSVEVSALPDDVDVFHVEPLTVPGLDAERCLVWMQLRC